MKRAYRLIMLLFCLLCIKLSPVFSGDWVSFNQGWKFTKGNPENVKAVNFDDHQRCG